MEKLIEQGWKARPETREATVVGVVDDVVFFEAGARPLQAPRETFEALYSATPTAEGSIRWSCSCPNVDPVEVSRQAVLDAAADGLKLKAAADRVLPNYSRRYDAFIQVAEQMVVEGYLESNPFYGK